MAAASGVAWSVDAMVSSIAAKCFSRRGEDDGDEEEARPPLHERKRRGAKRTGNENAQINGQPLITCKKVYREATASFFRAGTTKGRARRRRDDYLLAVEILSRSYTVRSSKHS